MNRRERCAVRLPALALVLAGGLAAPAAAAPVLFDFENQAIGAQTPLSITAAGLTATFAGPAAVDPDAFEISYNSSSGPFPRPYRTLTTAFLTTGNAFGALGSPLQITFSVPVTSVTLRFALDDTANTTRLALATDTGGAASAAGTLTAGFRYPEGVLSYAGPAFRVLTLSAGAPDFQIDDLAVATVPEPVGLAAFGAGLAGLALVRRRSQR